MTSKLQGMIYNQLLGWRVELQARLQKAQGCTQINFLAESIEKDLKTTELILDEMER